MTEIAFILGLIVGFAICYWQRIQFERQLKQMLRSLSDTADLMTSLPVLSLLRRELTHLNQQQQKLQEEIETQGFLLDNAPFGYLQIDQENQLFWCNQQARELLMIDRWQPGQIRLMLELVRSYELDQLVEQTRFSQTPQVLTWRFYPSQYATDGDFITPPKSKITQKYLTLKAASFPLPRGQVGIFLENQQPLVELSHNRERAFSDLTHELRTPLTSISLLTEALQKRLKPPESKWVEQMSREVSRLMKLVQEWLDISQLEEDPSQYIRWEKLELGELIQTAWQSLIPLAKQQEIILNYHMEQPIYLEGDRERLIQVLVNLFDNGIKHSPPQSAIEVQVELRERETIIDVIDYGEGFLESDLPYVFERLYRGEPSRVREFSQEQGYRHGSGLGLSIVKHIVQAHGGTVEAKNHPYTGGAWIRVKLPQTVKGGQLSVFSCQ